MIEVNGMVEELVLQQKQRDAKGADVDKSINERQLHSCQRATDLAETNQASGHSSQRTQEESPQLISPHQKVRPTVCRRWGCRAQSGATKEDGKQDDKLELLQEGKAADPVNRGIDCVVGNKQREGRWEKDGGVDRANG